MIRTLTASALLLGSPLVAAFQLRASEAEAPDTVCISIAAFEPADYIDALIANFKVFSEPNTKFAIHLDAKQLYNETDMDRWAADPRVAVSSKRVEVSAFRGSIIYAHMLNAKNMEKTWPGVCKYWTLQASNMMWVRKGMEERVRTKEFSPLGAHTSDNLCPSGMKKGKQVELVNHEPALTMASFHKKLTSGRHIVGWGQPEGSFFPMKMVLDFAHMMDKHLKEVGDDGSGIINAQCYMENTWLQTYALNWDKYPEGPNYNVERKSSSPLSLNFITYGDKDNDACPMDKVEEVMNGKMEGVFAVKRVNRHLDHPITKFIVSLR